MNRTSLMKRMLACSLAVIAAFTVLAGGKNAVISQSTAVATSSEAKKNAKNIEAAKEKISDLEEKQKELDQKISDTKDDIASEEENQAAIEEQIETVQETILTLEESIGQLEDEIDALTDSIAQKELQIANKKTEIETGIDEFMQRIRIMYVAGSDSYTDILVGATDFYDMLMKLELVKRVADHDNDMIDNLVDLKKQYEADEVALEAEKSELEANKDELEAQKEKHQEQKDKLDVLYAESQAMIDQLEQDKETFLANQKQAQQEQEEFEAELQQLYKEQEEIKKKEEEERKRKEEEERKRLEALQQQQNNGGTSSSGGSSSSGNAETGNTSNNNDNSTNNDDYGYEDKSMFTWPVPGFYHISYGVGWRWGAYHAGIDIYSSNIRGAKICAAADGTVIRVENYCPHDYGKNGSCGCGGGYGRYCIIDHGDGWWTLYGHSEGITVSVGQQVKQGDVLGTVGSTGYSTGPHLHFEIRKNGVALNPSDYV
ncbi:M23 family metallopeptidase [Ruminococcus sp. Marseille-P6503]|uniref:murein hydrolase activator EnvC family protein n=1 Tax=Ruminococcus sp. Marseille-P6503 TaxID=2364796 RepID=UPI000F544932|nr:M23 family metallopeptidase [Ruminococcus sp. Marseille-P6503]